MQASGRIIVEKKEAEDKCSANVVTVKKQVTKGCRDKIHLQSESDMKINHYYNRMILSQ